MLLTLVTIVHLFVCFLLVSVVLLQQGKGADMGATFGGGSQTLFGAGGADNLLTRVTTFSAAVFMVTSIVLAMGSNAALSGGSSLFQNIKEEPATVATPPPAVEDAAPALPADEPANGAAAPTAEQNTPATAVPSEVPIAPDSAAVPTEGTPSQTTAATPAE